jgi:hypothetical protein
MGIRRRETRIATTRARRLTQLVRPRSGWALVVNNDRQTELVEVILDFGDRAILQQLHPHIMAGAWAGMHLPQLICPFRSRFLGGLPAALRVRRVDLGGEHYRAVIDHAAVGLFDR